MRKIIRTKKIVTALVAVAALTILSVNCNDSGVNSGGESKYLNMFLDVFSKNPGQNGDTATTPTTPVARFTIHFNSNGGGSVPEPIQRDSGSTITLPDQQSMERNGHRFGGWNTRNDGTGTAYGSGAYYRVTGEATLYAVWVAQTYKLTTNISMPNSGSVSRSPDKSEYAFGETVTVTATPANGYTFTGWSGAASGTTNPAVITMDGDKTLTAGFGKQGARQFTVYFNSNGGGSAPEKVIADSGSNITLPAQRTMEKNGYSFSGWNTNEVGTGTDYIANASYFVKGEITLFAVWTPTSYNITYTLNNGTVTPANPMSYTIETATVTLNNPTRDGYTFTGWTGSNGTTPQTSVSVLQGSMGNKNYTANWALITYSITYTLNNGSVTPINPASYTVETSSFTLNNPTRDGYTFSGWTGSNGTTPQVTVSVEQGNTGDRNYTANWAIKTYTLTTTANPPDGGTFLRSPNQTSYDYGTNVLVTATANAGYMFTGWSSDASGTVNSVTVTMNGNKSVTANFVATYTLTTTVTPTGGGTVLRSPDNGSYNTGASVTVTATATSGYTFTGWSGASTSTSSSITITMDGNKTLTANFTQNRISSVVGDTLIDGDGQKYKIVTIGGKKWVAKNLNYQPASGNSWCYENSTDNCNKYGRLYDWATAMNIDTSYNRKTWGGSDVKRQGVCPSGWHLPSRAEWSMLTNYVGETSGTMLKSSSGWNSYISGSVTYSGNGTDDFGFSAMPGGSRDYVDGSFGGAGGNGLWWTATEFISITATTWSIHNNFQSVGENYTDKRYGLSVRCLVDD
jgi:uncharacterized protein (TIGR02145 family)/uncharacterized repeat protein (TIGR02543 family)